MVGELSWADVGIASPTRHLQAGSDAHRFADHKQLAQEDSDEHWRLSLARLDRMHDVMAGPSARPKPRKLVGAR